MAENTQPNSEMSENRKEPRAVNGTTTGTALQTRPAGVARRRRHAYLVADRFIGSVNRTSTRRWAMSMLVADELSIIANACTGVPGRPDQLAALLEAAEFFEHDELGLADALNIDERSFASFAGALRAQVVSGDFTDALQSCSALLNTVASTIGDIDPDVTADIRNLADRCSPSGVSPV